MYLQNFRRYWKEQLAHAAVGFIAGLLLVSGHPLAGMGVLALVIARQGLEWANRTLIPLLFMLFGDRITWLIEESRLFKTFGSEGKKWLEGRDSPGIDLAYHLAGCLVGVGVGLGSDKWLG